MVDVGKLIEERMSALGMSQAELGRRIGRSKQAVQALVQKSSITTGMLEEIGNALEYDFFAHLTTGAKQFAQTPTLASPVSLTLNIQADRIPAVLAAVFGEVQGKMMLTSLPLYDAENSGVQPGLQTSRG